MSARGRSAEVNADSGDGVVDGGPGLIYMSFVVMEDLLDKLKLLNYEEVNPDKWNYLSTYDTFKITLDKSGVNLEFGFLLS